MQRKEKVLHTLGAALLALCLIALPAQNVLAAAQMDPQPALSYPTDPTAAIPWSAGTSGTTDIQAAFNNARAAENSQLGTSIPMLTLPSQADWNQMNDGEKALWLINHERTDRGLAPLHGVESNVMGVAQNYANYLLATNAWGHDADGRSPWDRMNSQPAIGACHDFLPIGENLAVFVSSGPAIPLPIERSVYMWIYDDFPGWGHRHAILHYPYTDNSGPGGQEGFLGIGRASGGPYKGPFTQSWPVADLIVMNVFDPCASWSYASYPPITVSIGGTGKGNYSLGPGQSTRVSYSGLDSGPVVIQNTGGLPIAAAIREAWHDGTRWSSSTQLMGLPASQLSTKYYFPSYNNVTLNEQLRFGNVGASNTTVTVTIGGVVRGTYPLRPSEQKRVNYEGLDSGPVVVESSGGVPIIAALREAWHDGTTWSSFSQMMGLPASQLSTKYVFPAYNNVTLNEQLRFGNVGASNTTVTVTIGGVVRGTYPLRPSEQKRVNYAELDSGPVVVESSGGVPIIVALRDAWHDGTTWSSFTQMMGLPAPQISSRYVFPAYDNVSLDGQLRFGNVGASNTTVTVTIGGVVRGTYVLHPSEQKRVNYAELDSGPVVVESSGGVPIIAALRDAWWDGARLSSFSQLMGLPASQISNVYYFPSYNNVTLDEQIRFGVP